MSLYNFSEFVSVSLYQNSTNFLVSGWNDNERDGILAYFNMDGSLNSSFNNGNLVTFNYDGYNTLFTCAAIDSSGRVLVGVSTQVGALVLCYNPDGTLDSTFGNNGVVQAMNGAINNLVLDDNDNIYVTSSGWASIVTTLKLDSNGLIDSDFGNSGYLDLSPIGLGYIGSLSINGESLFVTGGNNSFQLAKYHLSDGSLDTSFNGGTGYVSQVISSGLYIGGIGGAIGGAGAAIVQSDGKIVLIGNAPDETGSNTDITLVRYNPNGTLDTTFGLQGIVQYGVQGINETPTTSGYQTGYCQGLDGSIYVAANANGNCVLVKFTADGVLDTNFTSNASQDMPVMFMQGEVHHYGYIGYFLLTEPDGSIGLQGRGSSYFARFDIDGNLIQTAFQGSGNLMGTSAADIITGDISDDIISGESGSDVLIGGGGDDIINGGAGVDIVDFSDVTNDVVVNLTAGTATGDGTDTLTGIENAVGGLGNDTLSANNTTGSELEGGAGSDTLNGGSLADVLYGGDGNDIVNAGAGNDLIIGGDGAGDDTYNGGDGIDTVKYTSATAAITVNLSTLTGTATSTAGGDAANIGNDTLTGIENIIAGNFNDILVGSSANNVFTGESGNDNINGGVGNDTAIYKGTRSQYTITNNNNGTWTVADTVVGRDGTDTISNIEFLQFTDQTFSLTVTPPQTLTGTSTVNTLTGGAGNDILIGLGGTDILNGAEGSDLYVMTSASDHTAAEINDTGTSGIDEVRFTTTLASTLNLYALDRGIEAVTIGTGNAASAVTTGTTANNINAAAVTNALSITGNNGNNTLTGTAFNDTLTGNAGNDVLNGGIGADTLIGGIGNDSYVIDNLGDLVTENANEGTDLIQSIISYALGNNLENLTLTGSSNINGTGNNLVNTITGNSGNNILDGGNGVDRLVGGAGNDTYIVDVISATGLLQDTMTEGSNAGTDTIQLRGTYSGAARSMTLATNFENLDISNTGSSLYNLTGNTVANTLIGNAANNILNGLAGADTMAGGAGDDTYVVDNAGDVVTEQLNAGTDLVQVAIATANGTYALTDNVENGTLTNTVAFNLTGNDLTGNDLNNILTGNAAANVLTGLDGNDTLNGLAGADHLLGGFGNDILIGGAGNDTLTGDTGSDTFVFNTALNAKSNRDTITDFISGTDKIELENSIMTGLGLTTGQLTAAQFRSGAGFSTAGDSSDRVIYNTTTGGLFYDADGLGGTAAIQIALLGVSTLLTHQDIFIV